MNKCLYLHMLYMGEVNIVVGSSVQTTEPILI